MLKLIISNEKAYDEVIPSISFDYNLISQMNTLVLQDTNKTIFINTVLDSTIILSSVIKLIVELDVKTVDELQNYFLEVINNKSLDIPILKELQESINNNDFDFEVLNSLETASGIDDNKDSSSFIYENTQEKENEYLLHEREQLQDNERKEDKRVDSSSTVLQSSVDISADSDNNFDINILFSDHLANKVEASDISVFLNGIDSDAISVKVEFTDGITTVRTAAILTSGTWIVNDTNILTLLDGSITVKATVIDQSNNVKTVTKTLILDTTAVDENTISITDIIDTNGDFSNIIMQGIGAEVGNTITLYDEDNNIVGTAIVQVGGIWSIDISNLPNTSINDNEFFKLTETDIAGNVSLQTQTFHHNHYSWANAQTDPFDDFDLAGSGNDTLHVNDDDLNDYLLVDGGNGNDRLIFSGNKEDYTITHNANGTVSIIEHVSTDSNGDGIGDETIARNIEKLQFANGSIYTNTLVSPIVFDLNNDGKIGVTGETSSKEKDLNSSLGKTVAFDIDGDGRKDIIEWINGSGDGILINNKDGNAKNDMDGNRLFGDEGGKYQNGYEKLSLLDINNDGKLTGDELDGLNLWIDDGDAKVEEGELKTLNELGITSIDTKMKEVLDEVGKIHIQSTVKKDDGSDIMSEDIWFSKDSNESIDLSTLSLDNTFVDLNEYDKNILSISADEILDIKNDNDELFIFGDKEDKIVLEGGIKSLNNDKAKWENIGEEEVDGTLYNTFTSRSDENIVKVLIETDILIYEE
ncbi:MAG: hypothetical protein COA66_15200 [Arcobacter sp.]|nr:MAG: hypothetical protein COA66_15200 [Arcobacter sp.]